MDKNICAPNKYDSKNQTCFSTMQLMEMAKAYNRYVTKYNLSPEQKHEIGGTGLIKIKDNKRYLLDELLNRFDTICSGNEVCLTEQAFMNEVVKEIRSEVNDHTFRAEGPKNSNEWLSTVDINNILKQYEILYSDFEFLGAVPLNCDELSFCSLYKLDFDNYLKKGINKVAIVFNHDKYGESGSHWVTLYIDIAAGEIYYCDSTGKEPIGNINQIIKNFLEYYKKKTGSDAIYKHNTKPYQKDSSECGIYSCNFVIRKLAGETFEQIINSSLNFQQINSCRNAYFRNKTSKHNPHDKCDPIIY